jgi:hypothetical protein
MTTEILPNNTSLAISDIIKTNSNGKKENPNSFITDSLKFVDVQKLLDLLNGTCKLPKPEIDISKKNITAEKVDAQDYSLCILYTEVLKKSLPLGFLNVDKQASYIRKWMNSDEGKAEIEKCETIKIALNDIGGKQMKEIPKELALFTNLKSLSLNGVGIETIPEFIGSMPNLETLNLSCNKLTFIPNFLYNIHTLTYLDLSFNLIEGEIQPINLPLKKLYLKGNKNIFIADYMYLFNLSDVIDIPWYEMEKACIDNYLSKNADKLKLRKKRAVIICSTEDHNKALLHSSFFTVKNICEGISDETPEVHFVANLDEYRTVVANIKKSQEEDENKKPISNLYLIAHGTPSSIGFGLSVDNLRKEDVDFVAQYGIIQVAACNSASASIEHNLAKALSEVVTDVQVLGSKAIARYAFYEPVSPSGSPHTCVLINPRDRALERSSTFSSFGETTDENTVVSYWNGGPVMEYISVKVKNISAVYGYPTDKTKHKGESVPLSLSYPHKPPNSNAV